MNVELIVVAVVLMLVVGVVLYAKKNPGIVQADLQKLEDSIKGHVTAVANSNATVDHAAVVNAAANVVAAASKPLTVNDFLGGSPGAAAVLEARVNAPQVQAPSDVWVPGSHIDATISEPYSIKKTVAAGTYELGCGAGQLSDATPEIPGVVKGYNSKFTLPTAQNVIVTITPNKVPCQVSVGLMKAAPDVVHANPIMEMKPGPILPHTNP